MSIKLNTRVLTLKRSQNYTVNSKGLIVQWKVNDGCKSVPFLCINDVMVKAPRKDPYTISIPETRKYIRDIDIPQTPNETLLDNFENLFFTHQLSATEYYSELSNSELFDSIFTRDLRVRLHFGNNAPDEIRVEETYWDRKGNSEITDVDEGEDFETIDQIKNMKGVEIDVVNLTS